MELDLDKFCGPEAPVNPAFLIVGLIVPELAELFEPDETNDPVDLVDDPEDRKSHDVVDELIIDPDSWLLLVEPPCPLLLVNELVLDLAPKITGSDVNPLILIESMSAISSIASLRSSTNLDRSCSFRALNVINVFCVVFDSPGILLTTLIPKW